MLSTRLITTSSCSSTPSKRTRPSNGRSSSAGSAICSIWPLSPARGKAGDGGIDRVERRQEVADQDELAGARQRLEGRQAVRLVGIAADQLGDPRQRDAAVHRRDAAAEQGQPLAAADEEARQRDQQQLGAVAFRRPLRAGEYIRRAVIHRGRGIAPQPDALRRFPFGFADIEPLRLGALAPIDARGRVAGLVLAELPEGLALADPAAAVHPLRDGHGDPLGGDQKRRQNGGGLLGPIAQSGERRVGAGSATTTPASIGPSSPERRRNLLDDPSHGDPFGAAGKADRHAVAQHRRRQRQNIVDRRTEAAVDQRPGAAGEHQGLAGARPRSPGDKARAHPRRRGCRAAPERTSERIASTTLSPTGMRRTRRCAAISSATFIAGRGRSSAMPGRRDQHLPLRLAVGIIDVDLQQEAVELRFGQRIGAFLLQRVLGRQHMKRPRQRMVLAGDRDAALLHRLQQRRLRARARPVDLVGHQQLTEHRARDEAERSPPGLAFLEDLGAENIGRHQVGRALDALVVEPEDRAERLDEPGLGEPGDADQQGVSAAQQGDQGLLDHLALTEDDFADPLADEAQAPAQRFDLGDEICGGRR